MITEREKKWGRKFPNQLVVPHGSYTTKEVNDLVNLFLRNWFYR